MPITFDDFINKYDGKAIDFDGSYGNQCFDLYRQYCKEVLNIPQSPPTGTTGAVTIATNYLSKYLDKYENTPTGVPEKGDILVWGKTYGFYGHVAVFISGDVNGFTSFDQNDPIGTLCHKQKHTYKGLLCWLRLKSIMQEKTYTQAEWQLERDERNKNWELYKGEIEKNKTLTSENEGLKEERDSIRDKYNALIQYIFTKCNPLKPLIDQSEDSAKAEIVSLVSNIDILNNEIRDNQKKAEKKELALVQENEVLQGKLDTLQNQLDKMKLQHSQDLDSMQSKIDKVQAQVEANNDAKKENNIIATWIENIFKKLKG